MRIEDAQTVAGDHHLHYVEMVASKARRKASPPPRTSRRPIDAAAFRKDAGAERFMAERHASMVPAGT